MSERAHVFFKEGKLYLIPELPTEQHNLHLPVEIEKAKANALPVVNPELLKDGVFMHRKDIDDFVNGKLTELYEWPGTWEESYYCSKEVDEKCAKLIAPQQPQADTQQQFFDYFIQEHNVMTLYSDFSEVQSIFKKEWLPIIERAFVAGRSKTSWEQFKKDNEL